MDSNTFAFVSDDVAVAAYQYMPMIWFLMVGIVGLKGSQAMGQIQGASTSAAKTAQTGMKTGQKVGTAIATKGKSEMPKGMGKK